ncbi:uncharacterized protein V3H86_008801 isoform 1-T1 [Mergus octosetaceus]
MAPCRPAVLTRFRSKGWHRVILCITATTLVVNLLFTTLLLHGFHQLHERGCSEAVNLTIGFVIPAVAVLPMLLLLFLWSTPSSCSVTETLLSAPTPWQQVLRLEAKCFCFTQGCSRRCS